MWFFLCGALSAAHAEVVYEAALNTEAEFDQWMAVDTIEDATTWGFDSYTQAAV